MSYQVIARKWRPQSFNQLVGQDHITVTLRNALRTGRLHHALLFTGPRGTGKTSSARILAKSIRCPNAVDFVPCNTCVQCEEISQGRSMDVIEIDGASNNGVEAVRDLRDTVSFMPTTGRFKVYIIDEVHMLSTAAFNALLKTLEEPPEHIIFVFATTEVHKIPATVLSRVQRFDFRRIATRTIAERLQLICKEENIEATEDSLWMLARQGDGSMRDSLSLLDQAITFAGNNLTVETVTSILGLTDHQLIKESLSAIVLRRPADFGTLFAKILKSAADPTLFIQHLIQDLRHLTMVIVFKDEGQALIDLPDSDIRFLKDLSVNLTEGDLQILFDMALKAAQDIHRSSEPQWTLEMALLRLATAPRWADFPKLYQALGGESLDAGEAQGPTPRPAAPQPMAPARSPAPATSSSRSEAPAPRANAGRTEAGRASPERIAHVVKRISENLSPQERWYEFVQKLKKTDSLLGAKLEPLFFLSADAGRLELAAPTNMSFLKDQVMDPDTRKKVEGLIEQLWGDKFSLHVGLAKEASGPSASSLGQEKAKVVESELMDKALKHPKVASFTKAFSGRVTGLQNPTSGGKTPSGKN